jgi:orotidine-5'-phosphate decarboxylase
MNRDELVRQIRGKKTYLCVGLDSDIKKIPQHLLSYPDPVFEFNKQIIDATKNFCVAYKINTAFYEALGAKGWETMQKTVDSIGASHFKIADAKRGDIGNSSDQYARAFFETLNFDAVTVAPYMGEDSIRPFLEYPGKWTIVLGLTSNSGAKDFELQACSGDLLYEKVLNAVSRWGTTENLMFVIGATQGAEFENVRRITPDHFYLVPGVGAQGGNLQEISAKAMIADIGLLVNVSRDIIFSSGGRDFQAMAGKKAADFQMEMEKCLESA